MAKTLVKEIPDKIVNPATSKKDSDIASADGVLLVMVLFLLADL